MTRELPHLRIGLAGQERDGLTYVGGGGGIEKRGLVGRAACNIAAGDLYTYPLSTTPALTLPTSQQLTFTWNPSCLTTSSVDIYLYTPTAGSIHGWLSVPYASGSYTATLNPSWWNNTAKASLQISIVDSNTPRFLTTGPAGPVFTLNTPASLLTSSVIPTATASGAAATSTDPFFQVVSLPASSSKKSTLPPGSLAAAILVPLLAVAVAVLVYVRFARMKEAEKRKRWSEHVDERMSRISGDWRAGEGIAPAPRGSGVGSRRSIAISAADRNTKASSFFGRTSSTYATEGPNMAGAGTRIARGPRVPVPAAAGEEPEMSQRGSQVLRGSIFMAGTMDGQQRHSRVSFAEGGAPRMSRVSFGDALTTRPTLAQLSTPHKTSLDNPRGRRLSDVSKDMSVSPSQAQGPFSVSESHLPIMATKTSKLGGIVGALGLGGKKKVEEEKKGLERQRTREEDWRQAEMTRRSGERMRDVEAIVARRSKAISQYSVNSQLPTPPPAAASGGDETNNNNNRYYSVYGGVGGDDERMEELSAAANAADARNLEVPATQGGRAASPMGMAMPAAGLNPDELLAAYAKARAAKSNGSVGQSIEAAVVSPTDEHRPAGERRNSIAGDKNPFRNSMVSDTSRYSGTGVDGGR